MNEIIENAVKAAKRNYRDTLKDIVLCRMVIDKVEGLIPEGWHINISNSIFHLEIQKGLWGESGVDPIEFKTVVKIVESIVGNKLKVSANVSNKEIYLLRAEGYINLFPKRRGRILHVEITLWNPKAVPDCEITYKRTWKNVPVISEGCLGISEVR